MSADAGDRAVIGAKAARDARARTVGGDRHAVGEEDRVVGLVVAGGVGGRCRKIARENLRRQFVLDLAVIDGRSTVAGGRRDQVRARKAAAADDLVRAGKATERDDVRVVLDQPVDVRAVEHPLIEGRHARRARIAHLRQIRPAAVKHHHDLHVRDDPAAVVGKMRLARGGDARGALPRRWRMTHAALEKWVDVSGASDGRGEQSQ